MIYFVVKNYFSCSIIEQIYYNINPPKVTTFLHTMCQEKSSLVKKKRIMPTANHGLLSYSRDVSLLAELNMTPILSS